LIARIASKNEQNDRPFHQLLGKLDLFLAIDGRELEVCIAPTAGRFGSAGSAARPVENNRLRLTAMANAT
jgi:hypothetical protein